MDISNDNINRELEEHLTELLQKLFEEWLNRSKCVIGTNEDKKETFFLAIKRRLEKGFSILTQPGMYSDEIELESMLNKLYTEWKNYMVCLGLAPNIDIFINSAKNELDITKRKITWKEMAIWQTNRKMDR